MHLPRPTIPHLRVRRERVYHLTRDVVLPEVGVLNWEERLWEASMYLFYLVHAQRELAGFTYSTFQQYLVA